jgi:hypothetical protein
MLAPSIRHSTLKYLFFLSTMKTLWKSMMLACALVVSLVSVTCAVESPEDATLPKGWIRAGSKPKEYEMVLDKQTVRSGKASLMLKFTGTDAKGFGTVLQNLTPDKYLGKRIRLSGYIKTTDAEKASFWLRVDGKDPNKSLAFDNMDSRAVSGTQDRKKYEIVLDVSQEATNIGFGVMLYGKGQMGADDLQIEIVGKDVPVTDMMLNFKKAPTEPQNLDFEN